MAERQGATSASPGRAQPAARLNCRATRPNAKRVSVINDRVDPASGAEMGTAPLPWGQLVGPEYKRATERYQDATIVDVRGVVVRDDGPLRETRVYRLHHSAPHTDRPGCVRSE